MHRFLVAIAAGALVAGLTSLNIAGVASAEARYVKSYPGPDSVVGADLGNVHIVFSERLSPEGTSLTVTGPDGARADQGDGRLDPDDSYAQTMRASLKPGLRPGQYAVRWTTVSAVDGQALSGSFSFAMTPFLVSSPAPGSHNKGIPSAVTVTFAERLNPQGSSLVIVADDGSRVDQGDSRVDAEGKTMRVSLKPDLKGGKYFVKWTMVSADTGDTVSDSFGFSASPWQPPSPSRAETSANGPASGLPKTGPGGLLPRAGGLPVALLVVIGLATASGGLILRRDRFRRQSRCEAREAPRRRRVRSTISRQSCLVVAGLGLLRRR